MKKNPLSMQKISVLPKTAISVKTWLKTHIAFSMLPILGTNLYAAPSSLVLFHRLVVSSSKGQATFEGKYHAPG